MYYIHCYILYTRYILYKIYITFIYTNTIYLATNNLATKYGNTCALTLKAGPFLVKLFTKINQFTLG